jgi:hypothetical protein
VILRIRVAEEQNCIESQTRLKNASLQEAVPPFVTIFSANAEKITQGDTAQLLSVT